MAERAAGLGQLCQAGLRRWVLRTWFVPADGSSVDAPKSKLPCAGMLAETSEAFMSGALRLLLPACAVVAAEQCRALTATPCQGRQLS